MNNSLKTNLTRGGACLGLLAAAFIWGIAFVFMKQSLDSITPMYLLAFRFTLAALFLLLLCIPRLKRMNKRTLLHGLVVGFCLFVAYALQTVGCKFTTAGKNAFLTAVYVVLVPFIAWIFFRKRLNLLSVIAAVLAVVGIGLVSLGGESGFNVGDWLTLACSVAFAVHIIFLSDYTKTDDVFLITMLQFAFASVFLWVVSLVFEPFPSKASLSPEILSGIAFLGIFPSGLAFLLQSVGQKYTSASLAAVILSLESVFGALAGAIVLHETMSPFAIVGCVIILAAVILSQLEFKQKS